MINSKDRIFGEAKVLLPKAGTDYSKWSVIACDQFTSNVGYWQKLAKFCDGAPSALNLILPECYLGKSDEANAELIASNMTSYVNDQILQEHNGYILVKRKTAYGNERKGLVMQVDLSAYDFKAGTKALIRATEGTVLDRLPPRVKIREKCSLELPHIMILIDDEENSVIKAAENSFVEPLYDFDLNMNGGHLCGGLIKNGAKVTEALDKLLIASQVKYGEPILMAVGDGNHSLAAAKECYLKAMREGNCDERLRYALVEVVNIYDKGLKFEPIHRAVFNINSLDFMNKINAAAKNFSGESEMYSGGKDYKLRLPGGAIEGVSFVQNFIDEYIKANGGSVDYIHGTEELQSLGKSDDCVAIMLKAMSKNELFEYIIKSGVLPRKTFSMGEAEEKRYYTECRQIR